MEIKNRNFFNGLGNNLCARKFKLGPAEVLAVLLLVVLVSILSRLLRPPHVPGRGLTGVRGNEAVEAVLGPDLVTGHDLQGKLQEPVGQGRRVDPGLEILAHRRHLQIDPGGGLGPGERVLSVSSASTGRQISWNRNWK